MAARGYDGCNIFLSGKLGTGLPCLQKVDNLATGVKDPPPPPDLLNGDCTRNHTVKITTPTGSISDKKA